MDEQKWNLLHFIIEIFISVLNLDMEKLYEYSSIIFSENIHLRNWYSSWMQVGLTIDVLNVLNLLIFLLPISFHDTQFLIANVQYFDVIEVLQMLGHYIGFRIHCCLQSWWCTQIKIFKTCIIHPYTRGLKDAHSVYSYISRTRYINTWCCARTNCTHFKHNFS